MYAFAKQAIDSRVNQTAGTVYVSSMRMNAPLVWPEHCSADRLSLRLGPEGVKAEETKEC
jgi:hypothetical protein